MVEKAEDGSLYIPRNKYATGVFLVFTVASIGFLLYHIFKKDDRNWAQPPVDHTQHWIGLGVSIVILFFLIIAARDQRPGLVFTKNGLSYNTSLINKGFFKWQDVEKMEVQYIKTKNSEYRLIVFHFHNSKKFAFVTIACKLPGAI